MDHALQALREALTKITYLLKPQINPLSFTIIIGKKGQGKSALLRQSQLDEMPVSGDTQANLYYNQSGIFLELDELWFNQHQRLLKQVLKQLNRSHRAIKITGVILCIDITELLTEEPALLEKFYLKQTQFLQRFTEALGYCVDSFILFTKLDALAGFAEFYQTEHDTELAQALGFSLDSVDNLNKIIPIYNQRYQQMIEIMGQKIISKMHPVRSTLKRTLIREFPLQLSSLRQPVQILVQQLASITRLSAIYFCSAEQGGVSIDRLNKKIEHEYALAVQDTFTQSTNYRPYFIEGAIKIIQAQTACLPALLKNAHKTWGLIIGGCVGIALLVLSFNHVKTTWILDDASKELLAYESLIHQKKANHNALYHLTQAKKTLHHASKTDFVTHHGVNKLYSRLQVKTKHLLTTKFMPSIIKELEEVISNPGQTPVARFKALKIYLMLAEPQHFSKTDITDWFKHNWQSRAMKDSDQNLRLLEQAIEQPVQPFSINNDIVNNTRSYLNALPAGYFFYIVAKESFPLQSESIKINGFNLAGQTLPVYYTKAGFKQLLKLLPDISRKIQQDYWVLATKDATHLQPLIIQAYCYDYVSWWKAFLNHSQPVNIQDYQQGRQLFQKITQSKAIHQLVNLVQLQTAADIQDDNPVFNQHIAPEFTELNLITQSSLLDLDQSLGDMEKLMGTLSVINDEGRTAFNITKTRFNGLNGSDPLTKTYQISQNMPQPAGKWIKQLADDSWVLFINDTRQHINKKWQENVFMEYQNKIAHRYPLDNSQEKDISLKDFNHFFAKNGLFNQFADNYIKPFLNTSSAQWQPKIIDDYMLPVSKETIDEIMRANIISNMFFPDDNNACKIEFSLQKINLDPVIANLELDIGHDKLTDDQTTNSYMRFIWPEQNVHLALDTIDGHHYEITENGLWGFFRLLEKMNLSMNENDPASLQVLFEINANSGRYLLRTANPLNPFTPGILNGFVLSETVV